MSTHENKEKKKLSADVSWNADDFPIVFERRNM